MTRADVTRPSAPYWRKYLFPCDCDDHHWLLFSWWNDDDFPPYLEITNTIWAPTIRERIKTAVKVLIGRRHYHGGVILDDETASELLAAIEEARTRKDDDE